MCIRSMYQIWLEIGLDGGDPNSGNNDWRSWRMVDRVRFFSSKIHNYNVHIQRFICTFVRFLELGSQSIANSAGPFQNITRTNSEKKNWQIHNTSRLKKSTKYQGWDYQIRTRHQGKVVKKRESPFREHRLVILIGQSDVRTFGLCVGGQANRWSC